MIRDLRGTLLAVATGMGMALSSMAASAYRIPTNLPEADGTLHWNSSTLVLVQVTCEGVTGLGYTYSDASIVNLLQGVIWRSIDGCDPLDVPKCFHAMVHAVRNLGRPGLAGMAISAVDAALWDLKGKLLNKPISAILGKARDVVPVYGSGGFTTYTRDQLQSQLSGWVSSGIPRVKMKIGMDPEADQTRVRQARDAIGPDTELYVDANGAFIARDALAQAERFVHFGVVWFEEPVPADDPWGLAFVRQHTPPGMKIAVGEYGYCLGDFRALLQGDCVDVLQADATRCGGITGFLRAAALADAFGISLSAHCAPTIHVDVCASIPRCWPIEYFHDHVRVEEMLFDGVHDRVGGDLVPNCERPGLGITFRAADAEQYRVA
jgi:L-alanine-DL-glutamate epimerase-like enolase superfamily enzyme